MKTTEDMVLKLDNQLCNPLKLGTVSQAKRLYRLTDLRGGAHPELDDLYESFETACQDAQAWWLSTAKNPKEAMAIGVEVSTPSGHWRTLNYQCQPPN
jgi:hypothetical protein